MNRIHIATTVAAVTAASVMMLEPATAQAADPGVVVIDGDTLVIDGETIRIQGIDTAEAGEACHAQATEYLRELVEGGNVRVARRDGEDRYGRTVASVSVGGSDVGMKMIRAGYASARYDSRDGYGSHPSEAAYHAAERSGPCTRRPEQVEPEQVEPEQVEPEQGQTMPPFWMWAALGTLAADEGLDIASFGSGDDSNSALAVAAAWISGARRDRAIAEQAAIVKAAAEKAAAEAAWYAAAAENERIAAEQAAAEKAAAEAEWYAAAAENERRAAEQAAEAAEAERERAEQRDTSGGSSSRARNDNPYDDGGPRRPDGSCPPGGCT